MTAPPSPSARFSAARPSVGIVHLVTTLEFGGLEKVVFALARCRTQDRFDARVMCLETPGALAPRFDDVTWTDVEITVEYANVDDAWLRMREGRPPFALAYGRMPLDQKQAVEAQVRELFRKHADEAGRVRSVRYAGVVRGVRRAD